MTDKLTLKLNGAEVAQEVARGDTLLNVLRADFGLRGPKYGCGKAQCGACTVLVDGIPARACCLPATRAEGLSVTTLEGLSNPETGELSAVQQGFLECEGAQCGYCLNGMVMTATALLAQTPDPSEADIKSALRHNLCRCGAHKEIIASIQRAAEIMKARADV